jgi:hypothetical protein
MLRRRRRRRSPASGPSLSRNSPDTASHGESASDESGPFGVSSDTTRTLGKSGAPGNDGEWRIKTHATGPRLDAAERARGSRSCNSCRWRTWCRRQSGDAGSRVTGSGALDSRRARGRRARRGPDGVLLSPRRSRNFGPVPSRSVPGSRPERRRAREASLQPRHRCAPRTRDSGGGRARAGERAVGGDRPRRGGA